MNTTKRIRIEQALFNQDAWQKDPTERNLFTSILFRASIDEDFQHNDITIGFGGCVVLIRELAEDCNISVSKARNTLLSLEKQGLIILDSRARFTIINIANPDTFLAPRISLDRGK